MQILLMFCFCVPQLHFVYVRMHLCPSLIWSFFMVSDLLPSPFGIHAISGTTFLCGCFILMIIEAFDPRFPLNMVLPFSSFKVTSFFCIEWIRLFASTALEEENKLFLFSIWEYRELHLKLTFFLVHR